MGWVLFGLVTVIAGAALVAVTTAVRTRGERRLADAREEALRWYERLGGQIMNLSGATGTAAVTVAGDGAGEGAGGDGRAVDQALVDAGERYNAAGAQLERSASVRQYELARETALEGLAYIRAARIALGLDPGPDLPPLAGQRAAGAITRDREVEVSGQRYRASGRPGNGTPYYFPGGVVSGRAVPAGWYSEPWWKAALVGGAWGIGTALVFSALLSPAWGDPGHHDVATSDGGDGGGGDGGSDGGSDGGGGGGDAASDAGGFDGGGFDAGGFDAGGFDAGGFDAGGFGGGGFDSGGF